MTTNPNERKAWEDKVKVRRKTEFERYPILPPTRNPSHFSRVDSMNINQ
jgi:hypothetical protein